MANPCVSCGACCAHYRVSFYWTETEPDMGGTVPAQLTVQATANSVAMRGTESSKPRCCALAGEIGREVYCTIYSLRASVCREFSCSWHEGRRNPRCDQARLVYGLPPLQKPYDNAGGFEPFPRRPRAA